MSRTSGGTAGGQGTAKAAAEKVKPVKRQVKLSREQLRHLEQRASDAGRRLRSSANRLDDIEKPATVKKAEKAVAAWERKQDSIRRARIKKINEKEVKVREMLLFTTPEEALRAVVALEKEVDASK